MKNTKNCFWGIHWFLYSSACNLAFIMNNLLVVLSGLLMKCYYGYDLILTSVIIFSHIIAAPHNITGFRFIIHYSHTFWFTFGEVRLPWPPLMQQPKIILYLSTKNICSVITELQNHRNVRRREYQKEEKMKELFMC